VDGRGFGVTLWFEAAAEPPAARRGASGASDIADTRSAFLGDPIQH
jgi:hypothetical protein